jgi:hypothetical protein
VHGRAARVDEREVRAHEIAIGGGLVGGLDRALLMNDLLQCVVDIGVGCRALEGVDLEALAGLQLEARADIDLGDEAQRRAGLHFELLEVVDVDATDRADVLAAARFTEEAVQHLLLGFAEDARAKTLFDDGARHLARPETLHLRRLVHATQVLVDESGRDGDRQRTAAGAGLGYLDFHGDVCLAGNASAGLDSAGA